MIRLYFIIFCLLFLSCKKASESTGPSNPIINLVEVGYYDTPGIAYDVYVSGQYAYVADGKEGLRIIDISNPSNPREVGFYKTLYTACGVYVSGQYAYVAYGDVGWTWAHGGLYIIDISTPSNPVRVGFYPTDWSWDVYVSGQYAYVTSKTGLHKIDISEPSKPKEVGYYRLPYGTPGEAYGVYVSGQYAYVAYGEAGLRIIKISD
jgi:hypothetical protein